MDATISIIGYKWKTLNNGEMPLMVRVSKDGKRAYKGIGISVKPSEWDFKRNCPKRCCPNRDEINQIISRTLAKYRALAIRKKERDECYTAASLLEEDRPKTKDMSIEEFLANHISHLREIGKVGNSYAYLNLKTTLGNCFGKGSYTFGMIDLSFCNRFENWMRKNGYKDTSMSYYFRTLRAAYNKAIEKGYADRNRSPFIEYKVGKFSKKTMKRALSKESIQKIINMDCNGLTPKAMLAHDIFTFSYLCGGISMIDIANLTPNNIIGDRLIYKRHKTNGDINLMMLPQARQIIDKYSDYQKKSGKESTGKCN